MGMLDKLQTLLNNTSFLIDTSIIIQGPPPPPPSPNRGWSLILLKEHKNIELCNLSQMWQAGTHKAQRLKHKERSIQLQTNYQKVQEEGM